MASETAPRRRGQPGSAVDTMAASFAAAVARDPTASTDNAAAGREAVLEVRRTQMEAAMAHIPGRRAPKRQRQALDAEQEEAFSASGVLCSPALVHGAPLPPDKYMFARPTEAFVPPLDPVTASRLVLQAEPKLRVVDDEGMPVPGDVAAATDSSASARAKASAAQGASLDDPTVLDEPRRAGSSSRAGPLSKRARGPATAVPAPDGSGPPGSDTGFQLTETEERALARGAHDSRASGACSGAEASMALARGVTEGAAEMARVARAPTLAALDDFLTLVGRVYYREPETGVSSADGSGFIVLRRTVLGRLTSPLRRPTVLDKWSPYQAALFESAICLVGKDFNAIADLVEGKTEQDVMEFYYAWKKSKNYARWKATFRPPARV
ncbi:hypothetical protein FNF27_01343 [Cafeteria roenbergensis]|uniref:SANT domain-containing protein n=2 Tax=Cafeteria roenbergensis TaxID=33653 RepID=A0A5A8EGI9_CAFRO|nr:hypothetical protein FNF28_00244 [Cafeteria roenbergensis]KAA0177013.1 hypothetical protein FNF27_01343 [Cafeteria roenbergensis]